MQHKLVKNELILSTFCYTVERIERNIDGYLKKKHCVYLVPLKQFCLDHGSRSKVLNRIHLIVAVKMSQKHISPYDITFSFFMHTRR